MCVCACIYIYIYTQFYHMANYKKTNLSIYGSHTFFSMYVSPFKLVSLLSKLCKTKYITETLS